MAIGWLSVLQLVPWGDVISNAPKIADGAKKLWSSAAKRPPGADVSTASEHSRLLPQAQAQAIAELASQLARAQVGLEALQGQMLVSSELIKALADQNTELVRCVEIQRVTTRWLSVSTGVLALAIAVGWVLTLYKFPT